MPIAWQDKMADADMDEHNSTILQIKSYMDRQHAKDPYVETKSTQNTNSSFNSNNPNTPRTGTGGYGRGRGFGSGGRGCGDSRGGGRAGQSNGRPNTNNTSGGRDTRRIQATDPCPLPGHGNHSWGDCRAN